MTLASRLEPCPLLLGMKTVSGNGEFWLDLNEELNSNLCQNPLPYKFCCSNKLAHWYSDCAAASKPAETGLIPVWVTLFPIDGIEDVLKLFRNTTPFWLEDKPFFINKNKLERL